MDHRADTGGVEIIAGSYSPSDSPTEARAKRRRGGRGFYVDRDRPYQEKRKPRHVYRDRHRPPERREAAALGRELAQLAGKFPRFRDSLNRTRNHVLVQARSEQWKRQAVLRCIGAEPMAMEELVEDTALDASSIRQALSSLAAKGAVVTCNRIGAPVRIRRDDKPAEKLYWKRG